MHSIVRCRVRVCVVFAANARERVFSGTIVFAFVRLRARFFWGAPHWGKTQNRRHRADDDTQTMMVMMMMITMCYCRQKHAHATRSFLHLHVHFNLYTITVNSQVV